MVIFALGAAWADESIPTFHYNAQRTGQTNAAGPSAPELLWSFRAHASFFASPVIGTDGTLYLATSDGTLYALAKNGTVNWTFQADESLFGTPAIAPDGNILFGDLAGNYYAVDTGGKQKWIYKISQGKERRIVSSAVVAPDGQSYFGAWSKQLYAIGADGKSIWTVDFNGFFSSAPALDSEGNVYIAVNDSSKLKVYKYKSASPERIWKFEETIQKENRVISSPAIDSGRQQLYIGVCSSSGVLFAIDLTTGKKGWSTSMDAGIISSPAIGQDGTIYAGCLDGKVYAFNPDNGTVKWSFKADGYFVLGSPSVDCNGIIYIGDSDGILYALSPEGKELWRWAANNGIESAPVVASDGTLYFTSTDSTLYALKNPTAVWNWREQ